MCCSKPYDLNGGRWDLMCHIIPKMCKPWEVKTKLYFRGHEQSKIFVLSSAASGTLPEDVRTFYCCRRHNSFVVQDSLFLYSWQWFVAQTTHTHTHRMHVVSTARMVTRTRHNITLCVPYHLIINIAVKYFTR